MVIEKLLMMCEEHICACCQYFRSAIFEQNVAPEDDWWLCAIKDLRMNPFFAPMASVTEQMATIPEETVVEGLFFCKYYTPHISIGI